MTEQSSSYLWFDEALDFPPREVLERVMRDMGLFGHGVMVVHGASAEHMPFERIGFAERLSGTRAAQRARLRAFLDEVQA